MTLCIKAASYAFLLLSLLGHLQPFGAFATLAPHIPTNHADAQELFIVKQRHPCELLSGELIGLPRNRTLACNLVIEDSGAQDRPVLCKCNSSNYLKNRVYRLSEDWHCSRISSGLKSAMYECIHESPPFFTSVKLPRISCTPAWYKNESSQCPSGTALLGDVTLPAIGDLTGFDLFLVYVALVYSYMPFVVAAGVVLEFLWRFSTRSFAFLLFAVCTISFNERCLKAWIRYTRPDLSCVQSCGMPSSRCAFSIGFFTLRYLDALYRLWNQGGLPIALSARRMQWRLPSRGSDLYISPGHFTLWTGIWFFLLIPVPMAVYHLNDNSFVQAFAGCMIGFVEAFVFFRILKVFAMWTRHKLGQRICCLKHDYNLPSPLNENREIDHSPSRPARSNTIEVATAPARVSFIDQNPTPRSKHTQSSPSTQSTGLPDNPGHKQDISSDSPPQPMRSSVASDVPKAGTKQSASHASNGTSLPAQSVKDSVKKWTSANSHTEDRRRSSSSSSLQSQEKPRPSFDPSTATILEETKIDDSWKESDGVMRRRSQAEVLKAAIEEKMSSSMVASISAREEREGAHERREIDILGSVLATEEKMENKEQKDSESFLIPGSTPQSFLVQSLGEEQLLLATRSASTFNQSDENSFVQPDENGTEWRKITSVDLSAQRHNFSLDASGVFEHEDLTATLDASFRSTDEPRTDITK